MSERIIVLVAHPDVASSTSQQFLIQSGLALQDNVTYVDLHAEFIREGHFSFDKEWERLKQFDCFVFQFQLYWYQAPAILKIWMDTVFDGSAKMYHQAQYLRDKGLSLVVVAGVKASEYQSTGREHVTMDALLSPYVAFAHHFEMELTKPMLIHQFRYLSEEAKQVLMYRYGCYLANSGDDSFKVYQHYLLKHARKLSHRQLPLDTLNQAIFDAYLQQIEAQMNELNEVTEMVTTW